MAKEVKKTRKVKIIRGTRIDGKSVAPEEKGGKTTYPEITVDMMLAGELVASHKAEYVD